MNTPTVINIQLGEWLADEAPTTVEIEINLRTEKLRTIRCTRETNSRNTAVN
jgi:hypothetical protein